MKKGDQQRRPPLNCRLIKEFDFFNENRSGASHYHVVPALKAPLEKIIFPQIILNSPTSSADASAQRRKRKATRVDDDDRGSDTSKKKKSPSSPQVDNSRALILLPPPQIDHEQPRAVEQMIEDHEPILMFEKKLELSDVKQSQNRLLITGSERLMAALTEEERERVGEKAELMEIKARDPRGAEYRLRLRKWPAMNAVVLNREWFKLVRENGFQKGDTVQGWGYRAANRFGLHIKIVKNNIALDTPTI